MRKILVTIIMCVCAFPSWAKEPMQGIYRWTIGFDIFSMWTRPNGKDWGGIIHEQHTCQGLYIADRFSNHWGFEFGYSWTDRKPKTLTTNTGDFAFGATSSALIEHTAKVRWSQTYLDLYGYLPISKYVEGMAGFGIGWVNSKFHFFHSPESPTDPVVVAMNAIGRRTDAVVRANIGIQALWTERVGVRLLFSYSTFNNLRVRDINVNYVPRNYMNNSYAVLFGIYWNFEGHG